MRENVNIYIDDMIECGVFPPADGQWASVIVLITKDETTRFCVDFRKVNGLTVRDAHQLPLIDDSLKLTLYI